MQAWLAGATGLVGGELLRELSGKDSAFSSVVAFTRRPLSAPADAAGCAREHVVDFDSLTAPLGEGPAVAFCALGTTIKKAGSQEAFRRVDHDYVVAFASLARSAGASRFCVVSSLGADPESKIFYNRVKGETEGALGKLGFPSLLVFRPSLLLGDREEVRVGERLGALVAKPLGVILVGGLKKYRAIDADVVARAMVRASTLPELSQGVHVIESDRIRVLGAG